MKRTLLAALAALFVSAGVAGAYSTNTNGTTWNGILEALTDLVGKSGNSDIAVATFTRPANTTAYASGQVVANSTVAGSVTPMQFTAARATDTTGQILRARLTTSSTSLTNASFRLHLYNALPASSNGDGGAWLSDKATNYIGCFDVTLDKAFTDGAKGIGTPCTGSAVTFQPATGTRILYGLTEARGAYTPLSAGTFTWALEVGIQN